MAGKSIIEKIEPTGFIKAYLDYASKLTSASLEFKLAGALATLATCCGSKIIYPGYGGQRQWPNLYVLLIAPSAFDYKTTSVRIARDLIAEADEELILSNETTREKFIGLLGKTPNVIWAINEFAAVLAVWNRDYAGGFRELITDLFDPQEKYVREKVGNIGGDQKIVIHRPALSIFAASTLDWLKEKLTEGDLRGGLMGRFIIFPPGDKTEDPGLQTAKPPHDDLIHHLKSLRSLDQSWIDIKGVLKEYSDWEKKALAQAAKNYTPELSGFQSRLSSHVLKLAVLFCISDHPEPQKKYTLSSENLYKAITLGKWLTIQSTELATTGFTKSKTEQNIQKLLGLARQDGGIPRTLALRSLHITSRELKLLEQTAVERGELRLENETGVSKPTTFYVAVKKEEV